MPIKELQQYIDLTDPARLAILANSIQQGEHVEPEWLCLKSSFALDIASAMRQRSGVFPPYVQRIAHQHLQATTRPPGRLLSTEEAAIILLESMYQLYPRSILSTSKFFRIQKNIVDGLSPFGEMVAYRLMSLFAEGKLPTSANCIEREVLRIKEVYRTTIKQSFTNSTAVQPMH